MSQEIAQRRPLTHDLLKTVIEELGGTLAYVLISDIREDIYYARLVINIGDDRRVEIDSRSSDAIALAVRVRVPIFVAESVLDRAGIRLENDIEVDVEAEDTETDTPAVDTRKLSAFADFLDTLDLDDLGDEDK